MTGARKAAYAVAICAAVFMSVDGTAALADEVTGCGVNVIRTKGSPGAPSPG